LRGEGKAATLTNLDDMIAVVVLDAFNHLVLQLLDQLILLILQDMLECLLDDLLIRLSTP
jgi:hypothetical protein